MNYTQEIKISVPEGKKAVYNEALQTIKFVDAERVRSKTWDEFCQNHPNVDNEYAIAFSCYEYASNIVNGKENKRKDKCWLETKEDTEGILAIIQLKRLHDEWVGKYDHRYFAVVRDKDDNITLICHTLERERSFLSFPTIEMATEFMTCFKDLIEQAKMFL